MKTKIFLEKNSSKKSVNTSSGLNVDLVGGRKLLPTSDFSDIISAYEQYNEERSASTKIRLTCQVNPICSNVLFNRISEIVKDEGSSSVSFINYGIITKPSDLPNRDGLVWSGDTLTYQSKNPLGNKPGNSQLPSVINQSYEPNGTLDGKAQHPTNAIRNMELSNQGFVYHCGLDVFNNHLIRSKTFKVVCDGRGGQAFNTIADLMRDAEGNRVAEKLSFPTSAGIPNNAKFVSMHLYEYDDIYSYKDCVSNKLIGKFDGWFGFKNESKIKSYIIPFKKDEELNIERPIMYKNGGDFIDMYPSRDLYSFIPKYNRFKHRIEKNWNYCITYPSSSTTKGFDDIIDRATNTLKTVYFDENTKADNGTSQIVMYSIAKHGLSVGDYVNIYSDGVKVLDSAKVTAIADDYIFTVFSKDTKISNEWVDVSADEDGEITIGEKTYTLSYDGAYYVGEDGISRYYIVNRKYVNFDDNAQNVTYKKVSNGNECEYYVRIFSKLPNFKFASASTSNEYELYRNNEEVIKEYQSIEYEFASDISKLAFAKNIYADEIGQVVFTDDIDIANLRDNLGRPLTSIYITFIKNNKGYKEWYGHDVNSWETSSIRDDNVEFSHCFGMVSCGFETSYESSRDVAVNNIHKMSRANFPYGYDVSFINGERSYSSGDVSIQSNEVWYELDKNFYGDLVCYDVFAAKEQVLQPILHRFNTAQRECFQSDSSQYFKDFSYDEITNDDYDKNDRFVVTSYSSVNVLGNSCNKLNEGYYYQPHYEIKVRDIGKMQSIMPQMLSIRSLVNSYSGTIVTVRENHFLGLGDKCGLFDKTKKKLYYCNVISGKNSNDKTFTCNITDENGGIPSDLVDIMPSDTESILRYKLFKLDNLDAPRYARVMKDGTCRLVWREIANNGFGDSEEEYPFTNGAFYVNKRVDIYVRRQDPDGLYGLHSLDDAEGQYLDIENEDNYVKADDIEC